MHTHTHKAPMSGKGETAHKCGNSVSRIQRKSICTSGRTSVLCALHHFSLLLLNYKAILDEESGQFSRQLVLQFVCKSSKQKQRQQQQNPNTCINQVHYFECRLFRVHNLLKMGRGKKRKKESLFANKTTLLPFLWKYISASKQT